ncbi:MAG: CPBP family intramembrane metalloprotease [Lachnospiraceae bacterium]|nr:CPBP family intramembrane metalloprotease [Lachnospiraceae bacterium]
MKNNNIFGDDYYEKLAQEGGGKPEAWWMEFVYIIMTFSIATLGIYLILGVVNIFLYAYNFIAFGKSSFDVTLTENGSHIINLFSKASIIIVTIIKCRKFEFRSFASMGIVKKGAVKSYILGLLIGTILFSAAVLICIITNAATYDGEGKYNIVLLFLFFTGYMVQGFSEEILCRGYFMVTLAKTKGMAFGIIVNSLLFSLLHIMNNDVSVLALINLFLFGIAASLCFIKHKNIWVIAAIHSIWNFIQGNFYGISVSGGEVSTSVLKVGFNDNKSLINGGAFGAEGGLAVTVVLVVYIIMMILTYKPVKKIEG